MRKKLDGRIDPFFLKSQRTLSPITWNTPLSVSISSVRMRPLGSVSRMDMERTSLKFVIFDFTSLAFCLNSATVSFSLNLRSHWE